MSTIKSSFQENGYYHAKGVFEPNEVSELEHDFDRIIAQLTASGEEMNARWSGDAISKIAPKDSIIFHTHNVQKFSATWLGALLHPRFLSFCTEILGENVVLHHTKLFQKPAEKGAPFPMHQDWSYFPSLHDTMMAGIIHVSEATDDMGCIRVVPGSHKLGRLSGSDGQSDGAFADRFSLENSVPVEAKSGDVLFFHYLTLHGSKPNRSSKTRKTVLAQLHSGDDAIEEGNTHSNERLVLSGWNRAATRRSAALS